MFIGELFPFQEEHENNLLNKCKDYEEIILSAPTGSGKTVLCSKFIDDYLDENPNTVFFWFCPGAGSLQIQSKDCFEENVSGIETGDVYDFVNDINPAGKVFFINWDKINRESNKVLKEGEQKDFISRLDFCRQKDIDYFVVIDEEHKYRDTANEYINIIRPLHTLRISATTMSKGDWEEKILDDEVIAQGLISENISINEGLTEAKEEYKNEIADTLLLKLADDKRIEIEKEYKKREINVKPLVIIQFPNGNQEKIDSVKEELAKMGYTENSGLVRSWFAGQIHAEDEKDLKKLNGQCAFLLFKQAVATGWDCPRAKILIKLREGGTEQFNIQTVGRIRRMPERHHYESSLIDNCYVYTFDEEYTEGLTNELKNSFYKYMYKLKPNMPYFDLEKEYLDGTDIETVNAKAVVKVLRNKFLEICDIDKSGKLDKREMGKSKGFIFDKNLKQNVLKGVIRTFKRDDLKKLRLIYFGEHEIDNHDDGFIIRDAKRKIASAIGIDEHISSNALKILFGAVDKQYNILSQEENDFENENKLLEDMTLSDYNAFLVNNRDLLIEIFRNINPESIAETEEVEVKKSKWGVPKEQYYFQHKKLNANKYLDKNVFIRYGDNILIQPNRSHVEILFENWCENNIDVECYYKNGDKGEDFFSIVYRKGFRRANFYPDYIIKMKNSDVWIIEAKGGEEADGSSKNRDNYAAQKFDSLKEYINRHNNIKFGFIRDIGNQIYISNTEWKESMNDRNTWKPIGDIVKLY